MKQLSIILPIYNVEEYLVRCFDSIYSQGVDEKVFEVIAVIDGSPDKCYELAIKYAAKHTNLVVINKENGGVSSARNKGIEVAKGKNVMFADPDDMLYPDSLPQIINILNKKENDIVILRSFYETNEREVFPWKNKVLPGAVLTGIEVYEKGYARGSVCGVTYSKYFLCKNNLKFEQHIKNSEDAIYFLQCQIKAQSIQFADIKTYCIFVREESASQKMSIERISLWFNALEFLKDFKENKTRDIKEVSMVDGLTYSIISDIVKNSIKAMGWNAKRFLQEHHIKDFLPLCKENIKHSKGANHIMKKMINTSFRVFFAISYFRYK